MARCIPSVGTFKRTALAVFLATLLVGIWTPLRGLAGEPRYNLKVGGTTIGGAFYPVAAAIGQVLNQKVPRFNVTVQTTPGAGANIRLLDKGEIDIGLSVTPVTYYAYNGAGKWEKRYPVHSVMTFFPNAMTFIVLESSPIKSIADLKAKRVTAGGPGAQWEIFMEPVLSLYNLSFKDFGRVLYMGQAAAANALKDGVVDAAFLGGGNPNVAPTPSLASLEATHRFRPLLAPEPLLDRLKERYPFLDKIRVRGGAYKSQPQDAVWLDAGSMHLVASAKADPEMVYQLVKAIYEHREEIAAVNPLARDLTPDRVALKTGTPYHEGAIRYYREIKVWKD
ncbi:MAG: TAXI family TRAP transporter solute-binding subunit [Deltaproteobacteria bacterium]|nr:TAXI family TRAP transporter solute-binding subunit [Deltaproteobacteria bacterium]MBI3076853.1 TAXI family TRAP transporter solute-binding subunit [Deltaproteobacteria bacterium]